MFDCQLVFSHNTIMCLESKFNLPILVWNWLLVLPSCLSCDGKWMNGHNHYKSSRCKCKLNLFKWIKWQIQFKYEVFWQLLRDTLTFLCEAHLISNWEHYLLKCKLWVLCASIQSIGVSYIRSVSPSVYPSQVIKSLVKQVYNDVDVLS